MEPDKDVDTITVCTPGQTVPSDNGLPHNPFSCNICRRSYTRIDHLARHYRSRKLPQLYPVMCTITLLTALRFPRTSVRLQRLWQDVCPGVSLSFQRSRPCFLVAHSSLLDSDLLKRHAAKHDDPEQASHGAAPVSKRRKTLTDVHRSRAQRACQACADAKVRCEGNRPCLRCQQKSIACEYPQLRFNAAPDPTATYHTGEPQSPDSQITANNPTLNVPPRLSHTSPPPRTALAPENDNINRLDRTSGQPSDFQLPTPSTFGLGKLSLP
jgi:Fungal Zn(2)-Cys(6) binuclear cluster domain